MIELNFQDKVVFVSGAGGNLGSAAAKLFLASGANLILVDFSPDTLGELFPEQLNSDQHLVFQGIDVNNPDSLNQILEKMMARFGKIDVLVNTIGGYQGSAPIHETSSDTWDQLFDLNARTAFNLSKAIIPLMLNARSGKIIHVAARAGIKGSAGQAVYSAAKGAVIRMTESMAQELKFDGINVNCVLPGTIDTPQNRAAMPDADFNRWVSPDAIAQVILFLASNSARGINGASIPVYGQS